MNKLIMNTCPLCESIRSKCAMACMDLYTSDEQFDLYICEDCGFTFTQGIPVEAEIDRYYKAPDYISHSDTREDVMNVICHHVRQCTLGRRARLVMGKSHRKNGRILDINTGTDYFAYTMQNRGWEVEAMEKNEQTRSFAHEHFGLNVKPEAALKELAPGAFDVITLQHVMEHLEHLDGTWESLRKPLTEKGVLIVVVPSYSSYDAMKYGKYWTAYDVPHYLWCFTPATIQQFGSKHGFILVVRHPMPLDAFYASMLAEKHKGSVYFFVKGMWTGTATWLSARAKKERGSSTTYVSRKRH